MSNEVSSEKVIKRELNTSLQLVNYHVDQLKLVDILFSKVRDLFLSKAEITKLANKIVYLGCHLKRECLFYSRPSQKKIENAAELSIRALQKIWACNTNKDPLIILFG